MDDPNQTTPPPPDGPATPSATPAPDSQPERIGRYRVLNRLGKGGFGVVYLAEDEQLHRPVAVKVPHRDRIRRPADAEAYLAEARIVAALDHAHIVPVYDVGATGEFPCFIVSRYIEGRTLAQRLAAGPCPVTEAVALAATIAETLHYAHRKGLVHRDIKPGNILLDTAGQPYVADFGLALKADNVGRGPHFAGTPAYMSPEQARGEGHRVDGRSDICSLGAVFYELLAGRRPFQGDTREEMLEQVAGRDPRPLRQIDDAIPRELERICLKALAKRAADRYLTAQDMADDLRHFLADRLRVSGPPVSGTLPDTPPPTPTAPISDSRPIKIVPKGLRSFDAHDADFFLELLPGPRDRDGLPDSIRFWKTRIEETDADSTFAVGLIYGPSGCGKSSMVKAGLLPRLSEAVIAVYVEATAEETETRLLNGLRKRCPELAADLGLKETLAVLRVGQARPPVPPVQKILIVLDQFEQWLHAKKDEDNTELVQALRQCDGIRLQCVVMVRDDFWLAVSRFMRALEIRLVEAHNSALVDLFDLDHAHKVLAAFGRAFGKLPEKLHQTSAEQQQFLQRAAAGLSQQNKVICVRLALFAQMMKGRPWTPATLKEVGGAEGIGATFLEETFSAASAPPEHRYHQKAARAVLKALLPESGTDIKGHMRSHAELLTASGYAGRPKDFAELIRILDGEIRLIAPTDPEGVEADDPRLRVSGSPVPAVNPQAESPRFYQLTHDYLVPSPRDWLTRKQKETRRGRAELLLADRAAVWNTRPENRQLPSLRQWARIRFLTAQKSWTPPQRKMMRKATRYHALRAFVAAATVLVLGVAGFEGFGRLRAYTLREHLLVANTAEVPGLVEQMAPYRRWIDPLLREAQAEAEAAKDAPRRLRLSLALLPVDDGPVVYLHGRLLAADPQELTVIRQALWRHKQDLIEPLWATLEDPKAAAGERLRAACALAEYAPGAGRWANVCGDLAVLLLQQNPIVLGKWADALQPIRLSLLPPLAPMLPDEKRSSPDRALIANLYATLAEAQPDAFAPLWQQLAEAAAPAATTDAEVAMAKRQANVAVALVAMGQGGKVWPLPEHTIDPTRRSLIIDRLASGGADPKLLLMQIGREQNLAIKRAIVLSLGEFDRKDWLPSDRGAATERVKEIYQTADDPGLRAAAEWLLRHWEQQAWLNTQEQTWQKDKEKRAQRQQRIRNDLASRAKDLTSRERKRPEGPGLDPRHWYVTGEGHTMVVIPGPVEFWMGLSEKEFIGNEEIVDRHGRRIGRTFAVAAKPVTVEQFLRFRDSHDIDKRVAPTQDCPAHNINWYDAAEYCNWLSEREGILPAEWCYETNPASKATSPRANYLSLTGYRLPTEAEMEFACRAEAGTKWCCGQAQELLRKYGWYASNSEDRSWPAGSLRPNDFGLFDVHGNVCNWCQYRYAAYPRAPEGGVAADDDSENTLGNNDLPKKFDFRVLRGGSFAYFYARSAERRNEQAVTRNNDFGFRPARTFTP